jgi:hypothetical protein
MAGDDDASLVHAPRGAAGNLPAGTTHPGTSLMWWRKLRALRSGAELPAFNIGGGSLGMDSHHQVSSRPASVTRGATRWRRQLHGWSTPRPPRQARARVTIDRERRRPGLRRRRRDRDAPPRRQRHEISLRDLRARTTGDRAEGPRTATGGLLLASTAPCRARAATGTLLLPLRRPGQAPSDRSPRSAALVSARRRPGARRQVEALRACADGPPSTPRASSAQPEPERTFDEFLWAFVLSSSSCT